MLHQDFLWETAYNYTEQREMLRWDFRTRNSADNISDIDGRFELFLDKEITQQIVRETYRNAEQYNKARGSIFSFRSSVRSWTSVRINKIYSFMSVLWLGGGRYQQWHLPMWLLEYDLNWFVHICISRALRVYQHTKDLASFLQIYSLLCHLNIKFRSLRLANQNWWKFHPVMYRIPHNNAHKQWILQCGPTSLLMTGNEQL
jgi:hypothetical protein